MSHSLSIVFLFCHLGCLSGYVPQYQNYEEIGLEKLNIQDIQGEGGSKVSNLSNDFAWRDGTSERKRVRKLWRTMIVYTPEDTNISLCEQKKLVKTGLGWEKFV